MDDGMDGWMLVGRKYEVDRGGEYHAGSALEVPIANHTEVW